MDQDKEEARDMAKLTRTSTPGIYRRHKMDAAEQCDCNYVVARRHRGRQHKETFRTLDEARGRRPGRARATAIRVEG